MRKKTEVLGLLKKADFSHDSFRWLTVTSPEGSDGRELQPALNKDPAGKAHQPAIFQQGTPAAMFSTGAVKSDYEPIKACGAEFRTPTTNVTGSSIAMLNDSCGNLIHLLFFSSRRRRTTCLSDWSSDVCSSD